MHKLTYEQRQTMMGNFAKYAHEQLGMRPDELIVKNGEFYYSDAALRFEGFVLALESGLTAGGFQEPLGYVQSKRDPKTNKPYVTSFRADPEDGYMPVVLDPSFITDLTV